MRILDELDAREERLREQLAEQRSALEQLTNSDSRAATALEAARQRAEAIGILNGTVAAQGPGLEMVIRDPEDEVRVADLLDAIQELRGAGAETMQIDDVRVGVSTAVTGDPGDLMIDGRPITAPYEFLVIGSPQDMETAMSIPGGVVQRITGRGGSVTIAQSDEVVVDALRPLDTPQYASPADRRLTSSAPPLATAPATAPPTPGRRSPHGHAQTTAVTPTSTSGRSCRAPTGAAHRRAGRHHRPRPGRSRRHRLRPAARGGRRGRPGHARSARWSRPSRSPTSTPRSPAPSPPSTPRWPTRPRRSTPIPTARAGSWRSASPGEGGDPTGALLDAAAYQALVDAS